MNKFNKEIFEQAFNFHKSGNLTKARDLYKKILQKETNNAQVWDLLGVLFYQVNDFYQAEFCIKKALEINPQVYYIENLAKVYLDNNDFEKAKNLYIDLSENFPSYENYFNLAMAFKGLKQWEKAKENYLNALNINPQGYESHFNLAYLALNDNDCAQAIKCYKKALEINPNDWESMYFLSLAQMQSKDYKNGLKNFESRLCRQSAIVSQEKLYPKQMKTKPIWQGEDLSDKTLFTYYEAGYGDMLMLYRFVPELVKLAKKVIIKPQKELAQLFEENSYGAEIIEKFDPNKELNFDYHIPFLSIPLVLNCDKNSMFIHHDKYLNSNKERVNYYREKYCQNKEFKIGIKWQGNTHYDKERVVNVEEFIPILELEKTQYYSFQTLDGADKLEKIKDKYKIIDLGITFRNFSDTAGAIENMDLIISNDTSLVHLAGAMGKQCWVLLPYVYNWRWHEDLSKCDWYDSVKIYRQKNHSNWQSVFCEVKKDLECLIESKNNI